MDKQPVGQLPDLASSNNDDEIMVITNDEYNQLKKEKISDFITDLQSTNENNALTKGTDGKMFVTDFGNASNITEGTLPVSVLPDIPKDKLPEIETDDLPDSGITAGTYTYPTDIVVNSKGQVTSITEGQAGANNANQDLSNLGPLGLDKLNQSKALETGSVSSDADVYADIQKYAHSTFDLSKFEVVGSLNITDDGIASGFGSSNRYIYKDFEDISSSDFTIIIPVKLTQLSSLQFFASAVDSSNTAAFSFRQEGNNIACNWAGIDEAIMSYFYVLSNPQLNTQYYIKVEKKGNVFSVSYRTDNSDWIIAKSATSSNVSNPITRLLLGTSNDLNNSLTYGSIDLKRVSVVVDDIPAFSGNQTGIDAVKPDDYTVVGTPTITADGIASGFSSTNNIIIPELNFEKPFSIEMSFVYNSKDTYQVFLGIGDGYLDINSAGNQLRMFVNLSESGVVYNTPSFNATPLQTGNKYYCSFGWNGTEYTARLYDNNKSLIVTASYASSEVMVSAPPVLGYKYNAWDGSIDLNSVKSYNNGSLYSQACLKIPYTLSKTGSKIVDAVYRDRVQDMYEQFGYAPYYTIDEENKNFTLPMGEIYGMMITKTGDETISGRKTFNNSIIAHNSPGYTDRGVRYLSTQDTVNWCQITQAWQVINGEEFKAETLLKVSPEGKKFFDFPKCTEKATTTSSASSENVAVVVQNYVNGNSWYRVWSDGWIQQGGLADKTVDGWSQTSAYFLKNFSNINYSMYAMVRGGTNVNAAHYKIYARYTDHFIAQLAGANSSHGDVSGFFWRAEGY